MLTRKAFLSGSAALFTSLALGACSSNNGGQAQAQTLTVAASPSPHAKILNDFAVPRLKEQNIDLQVLEYYY